MCQQTGKDIVPIRRRLTKKNRDTQKVETIDESAITELPGPVVILGDPGVGKSVLTKKIGCQENNRYVRAGTFVRNKNPNSFLPKLGGRLVIDGLDEIASVTVGGGIDAILGQLSAIGNPPFLLSSREADWQGASARVRIEDDYAEIISVLHLEPFNRDDATAFIAGLFPDVEADALLDYLTTRGLDGIYQNPLTLRMIGEIARSEVALPNTRAELLERACTIMLREENPRHLYESHALRSVEELLLAGGAICASLLLCDCSGIYIGPSSKTPDDFLHLSWIVDLPLAEPAGEAVKTRLFQADGEDRLIASHRVIAEFLGARWLAGCFNQGASERRIRSLTTQSGGVPTSLRGINAWLAHFSSALAPGCIIADPYAVLRYGNAETLSLESARILLHELAKLAHEDPYFRAEDWNRHPAAGLIRTELKNEIMAFVANRSTSTHLTSMLLDAMEGSPIVSPLSRDLEAILFDPHYAYGTRLRIARALTGRAASELSQSYLERLLALGDGDSHRLAFGILTEIGLAAVPMRLAVEVLLASEGMTVLTLDRKKSRNSFYLRNELFAGLSEEQLCSFLDNLTDYVELLIKFSHHLNAPRIADAARAAVLTAILSSTSITPSQVWRWLRCLRNREGYDDETKKALRIQFEKKVTLRRGIQAAALLNTTVKNVRLEAFYLAGVSMGLSLTDGDVLALIEALASQTEGRPELTRLQEIVCLARTRAGLPAQIREAALHFAGANLDFVKAVNEWSKPFVDEFEERQKIRAAREKAQRQKTYREIREEYAANVGAIRAGDFRWLNQAAKVYLGRFEEFDKDDEPALRIEKFLGPVLAEDVFAGFMAALHRSDLPSVAKIVQTHVEAREWRVEVVLVCGIAEMVRREIPLDSVPRAALDAAYMAWRRQHESNVAGGVEIGPALEAMVLASDVEGEAFFRNSIEPELGAQLPHVHDLYLLMHDKRWAAVAGRLAIEWLNRYPALPQAIEMKLLDAAIRYGDRRSLKKLLTTSHARVHANFGIMREWLAVDFLLDFQRSRGPLRNAADDDRDFLWHIRRYISGDHRDFSFPLAIEQRAFIVEAFGISWPHAAPPEGGWGGDTNPWDASDFIKWAIDSIAAEPAAEATDTLQRLLSDFAPSYSDTLRHALAIQRRLRRDHEYTPASISQMHSVMSNKLPETVDDMRAYFGDRVATVQARMHATNTDMWEAYWDGSKPRSENFCRNRLIEHISGQLPAAIRFEPEMHMPNQKRADIAVIRDSIGLPVEIKGQWHSEVWDAPIEQLAAHYTRDWHAEGRGAYIVLWFGDVAQKQLPQHPEGLVAPKTPEELCSMLIDRIPENMRNIIDVYVIDVSISK